MAQKRSDVAKKIKIKGRHRQRKGQGGRTGRDGAKEDFTVLQYSKWKGVVGFSKVFLNWVGVAWQRKFSILFCFFSFWFGLGTVLYCAITVSVSAVA